MASKADRRGMINRILNGIQNLNPEFVAGYNKAQEFGEGYASRTKNFNDTPYARSMFQVGAESDAGDHQYLGYGGAFKKQQTGAIDPETGMPADPTGMNFGLGYTVGRAAADFGNNASLSKYWAWNHPLGVASDVSRRVMKESGEAKGNRTMSVLGALAPAVAMGAAAGNVELSSLLEGDITGRAAGSQAVERKRKADGTLDKDRQTETANAITEVAQRYILGRSGKIIDDYDLYASDKLSHGELPVDEYTYRQSKAKQYEQRNLGNLFGLVKFDPTNAINNEASLTQLGYTVPLSAATTFGGAMLGAGAAGRLMKDERIPFVANEIRGTRGRGRNAALAMGASMAAGALLGKGAGVVANDQLQGVINPRNKEFQEQVRAELQRRNQASQEYL